MKTSAMTDPNNKKRAHSCLMQYLCRSSVGCMIMTANEYIKYLKTAN